MKIVKTFQLKIVILTAVKYRCILHGNVCVMWNLALGSQAVADPEGVEGVCWNPIMVYDVGK